MPFPHETVLLTGVLELAGAIGLLTPRLRRWAGVALAIYVIAVWPANMKHAFARIALKRTSRGGRFKHYGTAFRSGFASK